MPAGHRGEAGEVQRRVEHELRDRVLATPDAQRLVWVPGIGRMVAYTLLLEIDDIARFPTVRHFHSYCRLVPGSHDSGGKTRRPPGRRSATIRTASALNSALYARR